MLVHIFEICMYMITIPVERVIFHPKVIPWKVARRIPQIMKLIPQYSFPGK